MKLAIICDDTAQGEFVAERARSIGFEAHVTDFHSQPYDFDRSDAVINITTDMNEQDLRELTAAVFASGVRRFITSPAGFLKDETERENNLTTLRQKIAKAFAPTQKRVDNCVDWTVISNIDFRDFLSQPEQSSRLAKAVISEVTSDQHLRTMFSVA